MKLLYLDTETTGINYNSAVVQIAGAVEVDGEIKEWFDIRCRPHAGADISQQALDIIGFTEEELMKEQSPESALKEFEAVLCRHVNKYDKADKLVMVCHNLPFDQKMLMSFYSKQNNKFLGSLINYKLNFCTLSTIKSLQVAERLPILENNKLETWCNHYGISIENAHDALEDIRATRSVFKRIMATLKGEEFVEEKDAILPPKIKKIQEEEKNVIEKTEEIEVKKINVKKKTTKETKVKAPTLF